MPSTASPPSAAPSSPRPAPTPSPPPIPSTCSAASPPPVSSSTSAAAAATNAYVHPISNLVAGTTISPAVLVAVEDVYGNIITTSSANITLAVSSGPGLLGGSTSAATAAGVATFGNVFITTAGTYTISATDATHGFTATSNTFLVAPGAATNLTFLTPPGNIIAGQLFSPATSVVLTDAFGNIATNNTSNVTVAVVSGPGSVLGTTTVSVVNGVATFGDLTIKRAGIYSLEVLDGALAGFSSAFNVIAGPAAQAVFVQQPTNVTANGNFTLVMQVEDAAGNFIGNSNAAVRLSLVGAPAGSKLNGNLTARAVNGIVTMHNISISRTGYFTLGATVTGAVTGYSAPIVVSGTPTKLAVAKQPPASVLAGTALSAVTVNILDQFGHAAAVNSAVSVSLIGPNGAVLGGTKTLHAINGVVTFSGLTISQAGSYTLRFTDGSLTPVDSRTITVTAPVQVAAAKKTVAVKKKAAVTTASVLQLVKFAFRR